MQLNNSNQILEDKTVDHLILLVGGNPLPNAVAGRLLVKDSGRITLVHTSGQGGTKLIAERLKLWFVARGMTSDRVTLRETDRTKKNSIYATIERAVQENEEDVGLHYTGGTAAMAVHAHAALKQRAKEPVFSYLDARTLCIVFDKGMPCYVGTSPRLELTVADLFKLHGWSINSSKTPSYNPNYKPKQDPSEYGGDGNKFERAVYQQLLESKSARQLQDIRMSTYAECDGLTTEFDVIALRGYQLFYLSCTIIEPYKNYRNDPTEYKSNKRNEIKQKLFEAFIRARQLGGGEACAALVCYVDDPTIEREVQQTLEVEGRVRVFGRKHLPKLDQHLSNWIKQQSREGQKCP